MTLQISEVIKINGHQRRLFAEPLESFWSSVNPRPNFNIHSTACWRGYVAEWEIRNKEIFLKKIHGSINVASGEAKSASHACSVKTFFPNAPPAGVKAVWFTGELRIPQGGEMIFIKKLLIIDIENGDVVKERTENIW